MSSGVELVEGLRVDPVDEIGSSEVSVGWVLSKVTDEVESSVVVSVDVLGAS